MKSKKLASGYRLIFGYLGIFMILVGVICLLPLVLLVFPAFRAEAPAAWSFLIPGLSSIAGGFLLWGFLIARRERMQLGKFQDSILLVLIWLIAIVIGAIPFFLRGLGTSYFGTTSFTKAIFESTSGYSSSGLTLFDFATTDAATGPNLYRFYRSLLLLFGGIGLVLIVTSTISDRYGLKLYTAEGHNDKLMPNLAKSARLILLIYLGYIVLGTLSYWLIGGLELFDAVNHSIAAVATGGFSTNVGGLPAIIAAGGVNSIGIPVRGVAIHITSVVLMLLGATNFVLHLFLFQGKIKAFMKDCEIRFFGILVIIFVPLLVVSILSTGVNDFGTAIGQGTFLFVSSITTTGFNTVSDIAVLGKGAVIISIILMTIGGGMGSTAGAIKQYRIVAVFKSFYWTLRDSLANQSIVFPHYIYRFGQQKQLKKSETFEAYGYFLLYITVLLVGTVAIVACSQNGIQGADAMFEFASALSGTGLSVGVTGFNTAVNWILILGMFAGRLEITVIYFAFYRMVRDLFRKETF